MRPGILRFIINEVLFWLGLELFSYAISIALAYVIIGVCHTMSVMGIIKTYQDVVWHPQLAFQPPVHRTLHHPRKDAPQLLLSL